LAGNNFSLAQAASHLGTEGKLAASFKPMHGLYYIDPKGMEDIISG
jgi:hypothetical protein